MFLLTLNVDVIVATRKGCVGMELLYYIFLILFIIFLNVVLYLPSLFTVTEEEVTENIRSLKRQSWFQQLLQHEHYNKLIVHDTAVRRTIGKFNQKRIKMFFLQGYYEKKLHRVLRKKLVSNEL